MPEKKLPAGWAFPGLARKCHWFDEGEITSRCGRWMHSGPRSDGDAPGGPDDCAPCVKSLRTTPAKRGDHAS
jgi:hypothetical protein